MRYHASKRVMSVSFERDPQEHADVILSSGRRLMLTERPRMNLFTVASAVGFGLVIGLGLEAYRRFVLPKILDAQLIPPLSVILFQIMPFVLLISALILGRALYLDGLRKQSLASEIAIGAFIDTDVYENGVETTSGETTVWMPWTAVRDINVGKKRIEVVGDVFVAYFPERAFQSKIAYNEAVLVFSQLRRKARKDLDGRSEPKFTAAPAE